MIRNLYEIVLKMKKNNISGWQLLYKFNKLIVNIFYPIVQRNNRRYGLDKNSNIVVSLTSFPDRINSVWITIATLLNQTVKPGKIILWLAEEQFPEHKIPDRLSKMCERGLEIRYCDDLKPHKKYYYTMMENPDAVVITVDDDIFYPENFVEDLVRCSENHSGAVCCTWAHEIQINSDKTILEYSKWKHGVQGSEKPSLYLMPVGCGGVLYPPCILDEEVFNIEVIKELCLDTDDLWLKVMAVKNKISSVRINKTPIIYFSILKTQSKGLYYDNVGKNRNDIALNAILKRYPEIMKILGERCEE